MLTRLLEAPSEQPHEQTEKALHQSALQLSTELAHELHCARDEQHAIINLQHLFYPGWGELLQPTFSLAASTS